VIFVKKNAVFWNVTPCGFGENRRSSETSVYIQPTLLLIPEDCIIHSYRRENLKSYDHLVNIALSRTCPSYRIEVNVLCRVYAVQMQTLVDRGERHNHDT
jgi:hypothetical protein